MIRPMTKRDVPAVLELFRRCHPGWTERPAAFYLTQHRTFVAVEATHLVGYTVLGFTPERHAFGSDTGVHPDWQGKGLGRALHDAKVEAARQAGATHFVGLTWDGNRAMTKILTASGFVKMTTVPGHFAENPTKDDGHTYVIGLTDG